MLSCICWLKLGKKQKSTLTFLMNSFSARHGQSWNVVGKPKIDVKNKVRQRIARLAMALVPCFLAVNLGFVVPVQAAEAYQAQVSAGSVTIPPGQTKVITLKFKNIGTKTWVAGK